MADDLPAAAVLPPYAELHCLSNFSFQRGASHPEELVERAHALGYAALAITDECSMAGVVRAHVRARQCGLKLLLGTELRIHTPQSVAGWFTLVLLARNRAGYGQLCELITRARAGQGGAPQDARYHLELAQLQVWMAQGWPLHDVLALAVPRRVVSGDHRVGSADRQLAIPRPGRALEPEVPVMPHGAPLESIYAVAHWLRTAFADRAWLVLELWHQADDGLWRHKLHTAATLAGVPLVAAGGVHMHVRSRKPLQDVLTAVRLGKPVAQCGEQLLPNAEAHLRSRLRLAHLYPAPLLEESVRVASLCQFSLDELRYEYPQEVVPPGHTPRTFLRHCTASGALQRYPQGVPKPVQAQLEHELALIEELHYERYFLTVYDLVRFARSRGILCQGRGAAANSAVCYCLGITEVDPARASVLFERFISRERNEPPDIDVDFEHQRREEVIQYLYGKYGRHRAALAAAVITYRARSTLRDVGQALGVEESLLDALARRLRGWDGLGSAAAQLRELGQEPDAHLLRWWLELSGQLLGFPQHLSQHSGGFVLTGDALTSTVPVVPAAMAGRTTIEWDKDDIDALGLLKVDVLALGMLSAIRRALVLVGQWRGKEFRMQDIPAEDPTTYDMVCRADTVGVFQIESRAQMSMLPRLQPRCFYDLVVEVAIVRPGPIQGGMVHPYLQRRAMQRRGEAIEYPSEALRGVLERTLGIPIFQEQVMQIACVAAGFTPGEADALRRSMAAWRRKGGLEPFRQRLVGGMTARGYTEAFAQAIFRQIEGFGEYGFPESHAASFALLVYASAWLKCHEPACFLAALLNSLPMGFYGPAQLVQDAQRHGVQVLPVDVSASDWDCTLEGVRPAPPAGGEPSDRARSGGGVHAIGGPGGQPAVRLGLRLVAGLSQAGAARIVAQRAQQAFANAEELALRCALDTRDLQALASADALHSLCGHRRQQVWAASALQVAPALLKAAPVGEAPLLLPAAGEGEEVVWDYAALGLSLRRHPLALLRPRLEPRLLAAEQLQQQAHGRLVRACGLVVARQQPETAKGVVFVTLEDETGTVQVIVWKRLRERQRGVLLGARLMAVYGQWQRQDGVCHLIAQHLVDLTPWLGRLATHSRDFH